MTDDLTRRLAMSLIRADARLWRDYARWEPEGDLKSIAGLALMPYLCAFVVDSARYLQAEPVFGEAAQLLRPYEHLLSLSRLRAKLFDDSRLGFEGSMEVADKSSAAYSDWFFRSRVAWVRRARQRCVWDLAVFTLERQLLTTSHVAFLNLGMDAERAHGWSPASIQEEIRATAESIGGYAGAVLEALGESRNMEAVKATPGPRLKSKNLRSATFYAGMPLLPGPRRRAAAVVLTSLLCTVNAVRLVVPHLSPGNEEAELRAQFITMFHVRTCLSGLLSADSEGLLLAPSARERLAELVQVLPAPSQERKALRNAFVHYRVSRRAAPRLRSDRPLFGVTEAHLGAMDAEDLRLETRSGLEASALALSDLLMPP